MREIEERFGFIKRFAACFTDYRDPESIEHPVVYLLKQRLFGLCLGYEDMNDLALLPLGTTGRRESGPDNPGSNRGANPRR